MTTLEPPQVRGLIACASCSGPMGSSCGGRLAAAVSNTNGLGLVVGGYGDRNWMRKELSVARAETTRPWGKRALGWRDQESSAYNLCHCEVIQ
jgi:NAD(P)H-dependent flavin oxidoreductase YrpB (nitropropane dioxygenase family)